MQCLLKHGCNSCLVHLQMDEQRTDDWQMSAPNDVGLHLRGAVVGRRHWSTRGSGARQVVTPPNIRFLPKLRGALVARLSTAIVYTIPYPAELYRRVLVASHRAPMLRTRKASARVCLWAGVARTCTACNLSGLQLRRCQFVVRSEVCSARMVGARPPSTSSVQSRSLSEGPMSRVSGSYRWLSVVAPRCAASV